MSKQTTTAGVSSPPHRVRGADSPAFLLAQIGGHASARFADRLSTLDLIPAHAGVLRLVHASEGLSQQKLGATLQMAPSRLVGLIDELERRGCLERRDQPSDRRSYALYLTAKGRDLLKEIAHVARAHQQELCAGLTDEERDQLAALLWRIAEQQGLTAGVHPGFSRL